MNIELLNSIIDELMDIKESAEDAIAVVQTKIAYFCKLRRELLK